MKFVLKLSKIDYVSHLDIPRETRQKHFVSTLILRAERLP